jgi:hypothetical protein
MIGDPTGAITGSFHVMREDPGLADRGTFVLETGEHPKWQELKDFLAAIASVVDRVRFVAGIDEDLEFEVFVRLSCHNCPDVVQTLNQFALINPRIRTEMIDGGLRVPADPTGPGSHRESDLAGTVEPTLRRRRAGVWQRPSPRQPRQSPESRR